jgi:hypothetical protein
MEEKCIWEELREVLAKSGKDKYYQVVLLDNRCPENIVHDLMHIADQCGKQQGFNAMCCLADLQKKIISLTIKWINRQ